MGLPIGTQNKDLRRPPNWASPGGHGTADFFGFFESPGPRQWAYLATEKEIHLTGSHFDWKSCSIDSVNWFQIEKMSLFDLVIELPRLLEVGMTDEERLWLAAATKAAAQKFTGEAMARRTLK